MLTKLIKLCIKIILLAFLIPATLTVIAAILDAVL